MGTIADLNELTAPDVLDYWVVRDVSDVLDKDKKVKLGKFPLKDGAVSPTAGRVARWKDANTLEDGGKVLQGNHTGTGDLITNNNNLTVNGASSIKGAIDGNISGAGTLATAGFTLTAPATGTVVTTAAAQTLTSKKIDSVGLTYFTMGNTNIALLSQWTPITQGFFVIHDLSNGYVATFQVRAGANVTNEINDPSSKFSHTGGTATSINVYYLAGTGYVIQNNSGGSIFVGVHAIGA